MNTISTAAGDGYLTRKFGDIAVSYLDHLDGGGIGFGQDYIPVVQNLYRPFERAYEFCAGPGFIGFSLLANGLCKSLCLSDINPEAVAAARDTVRRNGLEDRVSIYESDSLDQIPASEQWDLVVSNPPHFKQEYPDSIRHHDADWEIHKRFYADLKAHLRPGAVSLIQENYEGSTEADFTGMIADGGMICDDVFMHREPGRTRSVDSYYFMAARRAEDARRPIAADKIVDCATPPTDISIVDAKDVIHLRSGQRYRFACRNGGATTSRLLVFGLRFGIVPRFIRTFAFVTPGDYLTCPFHFYPGRYVLKDAATKQVVARIVVD